MPAPFHETRRRIEIPDDRVASRPGHRLVDGENHVVVRVEQQVVPIDRSRLDGRFGRKAEESVGMRRQHRRSDHIAIGEIGIAAARQIVPARGFGLTVRMQEQPRRVLPDQGVVGDVFEHLLPAAGAEGYELRPRRVEGFRSQGAHVPVASIYEGQFAPLREILRRQGDVELREFALREQTAVRLALRLVGVGQIERHGRIGLFRSIDAQNRVAGTDIQRRIVRRGDRNPDAFAGEHLAVVALQNDRFEIGISRKGCGGAYPYPDVGTHLSE